LSRSKKIVDFNHNNKPKVKLIRKSRQEPDYKPDAEKDIVEQTYMEMIFAKIKKGLLTIEEANKELKRKGYKLLQSGFY